VGLLVRQCGGWGGDAAGGQIATQSGASGWASVRVLALDVVARPRRTLLSTPSSRCNLCKLLASAFPQLTARLSSMDVHVDVSLCRVIVTQIVTQLGDHPLRMDQREILGATRTARCSLTSPVQAAYRRSRPSRRGSGARSRIPHRVTYRSPWGAPSRLQCVRGRPWRRRARRVRAACLLRACRCPLTMPGT
jgi:hypothetical protein